MNSKPVTTLVTVGTVVLAVITALLGTGVLSAPQAAWLTAASAIINGILGVIAHGKVTPVADPKDADGHRLVRAPRA